MLILGGAGMALYFWVREQNKLATVDGLARLLAVTVECIKNYAMPAHEILKNCGRDLLRECGYDTEREMPQSFDDMLCGCDICDSEANELFAEFCKSFGKGQRTDEAAKCEYYAARMRERADALHQSSSGRKKTVLCLCTCFVLIVLILLL